MKLLADLIGTEYLTATFASQLQQILSCVTEIDLAGCRFSPACESVLRQFYGKVDMCNSKNLTMDAYLKANCKAARETAPVTERLPISFTTVEGDMVKTLESLRTDVIYNLEDMDGGVNHGKCLYFALLVIMYKPEITIDMGAAAGTVFKFAHSYWIKRSKHHDAYFEVEGQSIWTRKVVDGQVYIPGVGTLSEEDYVQAYNVMPIEFGTVCIGNDEEFELIATTAAHRLEEAVKSRKTMKSCIDKLKEDEDDR